MMAERVLPESPLLDQRTVNLPHSLRYMTLAARFKTLRNVTTYAGTVRVLNVMQYLQLLCFLRFNAIARHICQTRKAQEEEG